MKINLEGDAIRYVLRKRRKELGLTHDEIKDHDISKGSISHIETGKGHIKEDTLDRYLEKLGLDRKELLKLTELAKSEIGALYFRLENILYILNNVGIDQAEALLKDEKNKIDEFHPLFSFVLFLEGRMFYRRKEFKKAEKAFKQAIKMRDKYFHRFRDNIIASCYNELSGCSYAQNDLPEALHYSEMGINEFDCEKDWLDIKYMLLGNQLLYLRKSFQTEQASRLLDQIWKEVYTLNRELHSVVNIYKYRAVMLRDHNQFEESIQCGIKGAKIAREHSKQISDYLDFLTIIGSIHLKTKQFDKAREYFTMSLNTDPNVKAPRRRMEALTYLAILEIANENWEQAFNHIEEALGLGRSDKYRLVKLLIVKGNYYYFQKQYNESIVYYQEASDLSEQHGYTQRQLTALLKTANCFDILNETERLRDTLEHVYHLQKHLNFRSEVEIYEINEII